MVVLAVAVEAEVTQVGQVFLDKVLQVVLVEQVPLVMQALVVVVAEQ
jgi:hypothetical protein